MSMFREWLVSNFKQNIFGILITILSFPVLAKTGDIGTAYALAISIGISGFSIFLTIFLMLVLYPFYRKKSFINVSYSLMTFALLISSLILLLILQYSKTEAIFIAVGAVCLDLLIFFIIRRTRLEAKT